MELGGFSCNDKRVGTTEHIGADVSQGTCVWRNSLTFMPQVNRSRRCCRPWLGNGLRGGSGGENGLKNDTSEPEGSGTQPLSCGS